MSLKKKRKQRILFIRDYASFIEVLKDAGFEVTVLHNLQCDVEKVISRERPELIISFMDGLDYNGLDPTRNIPEKHLPITLSVSSSISRSDLLKEVKNRLGGHEGFGESHDNILSLKTIKDKYAR